MDWPASSGWRPTKPQARRNPRGRAAMKRVIRASLALGCQQPLEGPAGLPRRSQRYFLLHQNGARRGALGLFISEKGRLEGKL